MKRNKMKVVIVALLAITAVLVGCSSTSSKGSDDKIVLRASSGLPSDHIWEVMIFKPWIERVEEESEGRVEIDYYNNAELVDLGSELDALNAGTIDIGMPIMSIYDLTRFPLSEITMLPLLNSDVDIVNEAYYELVMGDHEIADGKTFFDLEMGDHGLKSFPLNAGYPYVINTTGKKFETVEDFKGTKLRIGTRTHEMFAKHLGASPINMSINDTYDALSRGALDGTIMAIEDWRTWGFHDQLKYAIDGALIGYATSVMGMTQEAWDDLPEDIQQIMEEAAEDVYKAEETINHIYEVIEEEHKIVSETAEIENYNNLDEDVQNALAEAMEETWLEWIEMMEKQGDPGKEIAKLWRDLIVEAGGEVPEGVQAIE